MLSNSRDPKRRNLMRSSSSAQETRQLRASARELRSGRSTMPGTRAKGIVQVLDPASQSLNLLHLPPSAQAAQAPQACRSVGSSASESLPCRYWAKRWVYLQGTKIMMRRFRGFYCRISFNHSFEGSITISALGLSFLSRSYEAP